jgi:ParB-like chromosome segregation protein Spo0J
MQHADKLETLPIDSLVPYARNARTHSPEQVAAVARSIQRFGFTNPVLIDAEGGIVAGHGRVMAAKSLGMGQVPCLRVGWLTEAEKRAYVLADNKLAELAGWDDELLAGELRALQADDFDLSLTGFAQDELDDLLIDKTEGKTDPDAVPPAPTIPVTQPGDVWVLGRNRIMCGDSTRIDQAQTLLGGGRG